MAHDLNRYGAAPLRAEIVQTKKDGDQTFAMIKFVFPRGDATSLCSASTPPARSPASPSAAWRATELPRRRSH